MADSLRKTLLTGGFWVLAGKLVTASSNLLVGALLARMLTQDGLGRYFLIFSLVTGGALVSQLGFQRSVVRLVAESMGREDPARARAAVVLAYRFVVFGIVAVASFLLLGGGAWVARDLWHAPALVPVMPAASIWLATVSLQVLTSETFRGFKQLGTASLFGGVIAGALTLAAYVVWWLRYGTATVEQAVWIAALATALSLAVGVHAIRRRIYAFPRGSRLVTREVVTMSLPLWTTSVTAYLVGLAPLWILGAVRDEAEVALYGSALRLVTVVSMPLILVNLVVPPFITELYFRGETKRLERILRSAAIFAGAPAFAVLLVFLLAGATVMVAVYGDAYRAGAPVLALLSIAYLFNVWTGSCGVVLVMTGFESTLMRITVASAILSIVASLLVAPSYGAVGVGAVVGIAGVCQNMALWFAARHHTGMWTHAAIPRLKDLRALLGR